MAIVYIWDSEDHIGHVSIVIAREYISFNPDHTDTPRLDAAGITPEEHHSFMERFHRGEVSVPACYTTEAQDIERYGQPLHTVHLTGLDEEAVGAYLKQSFDKDHPNYSPRHCNSATVVATLLMLGKHHLIAGDRTFATSVVSRMRHLHALLYDDAHHTAKAYHDKRHDQLAEHMAAVLPTAFDKARHPPGGLATIASYIVRALGFADRAAHWTPGDVLHLALYLRDH